MHFAKGEAMLIIISNIRYFGECFCSCIVHNSCVGMTYTPSSNTSVKLNFINYAMVVCSSYQKAYDQSQNLTFESRAKDGMDPLNVLGYV